MPGMTSRSKEWWRVIATPTRKLTAGGMGHGTPRLLSLHVSSRRMEDSEVRERTIKEIQEAVCHLFNLSINELTRGSSRRVVAVPRQIAMYLAKQMTTASLSEIGLYFGGKHHTTVMHSIAKVHELRRSDASLDRTLSKLLMTLTQRSG
jgi:chromosomal replication initiation ATPase DnaA